MFITDRDLLAYEPSLFRDALWVGQRLLVDAGTIAGNILTVTAPTLTGAGIAAGHVAIIDGRPLEVIERLTSTTLRLSPVRARTTDAVIAIPDQGVNLVEVWTLAPQIQLAHAQILRLLGLSEARAAALAAGQTPIDESRITNPEDLQRLEALMTLHSVYASLASMRGPDDPFILRAELYRRRVSEERQRTVAFIDTDFDGIPDVARRLNTFTLHRA